MDTRIRVAILEDQTVFRESLVAFLEGSGLEVLRHGAAVQHSGTTPAAPA